MNGKVLLLLHSTELGGRLNFSASPCSCVLVICAVCGIVPNTVDFTAVLSPVRIICEFNLLKQSAELWASEERCLTGSGEVMVPSAEAVLGRADKQYVEHRNWRKEPSHSRLRQGKTYNGLRCAVNLNST